MTTYLTMDDVYVSEGDGVATVTFRLSEPAPTAASVDFFTSNGTAVTNSDFFGVGTTTVNFAAGEQVKTVDITLIDNVSVEGTETIRLNLSNPVNLVLEDNFGYAVIYDDDNINRPPYVSVEDVWVDESDGFAFFNILIDRATTVPLSVGYSTQGGTATPGDYVNTSGTAVFAPGEMVKTIAVPITDDSTAERSEFFRFNLTSVSGVTGAQIADGQGIGFIALSDTPVLSTPTVSISDVTTNEGLADGMIDITLKLNAPTTIETSVNVFTQNGRAVTNSDFTGVGTTTVVFQPGETVRTISTQVLQNASIEGVEEFFVGLTGAVGLNVEMPFETITIFDNDTGVRPPVVSVENKDVDEKDEFAVFVIQLDQVATVPVTVSYQTVAGSASAGPDFRTTNGSVTINPGETSAEVAVEIIDDAAAEGIETFVFNLTGVSGVTGASIGDGRAVATIGTSDTAPAGTPAVTIDHMVYTEGESDGTMEIVLRLDAPSVIPTSVQVFTSNGTAVTNSDFTGINRVVRFEPGETVKTLEIAVLENATVEQPESFLVGLQSPIGLTIPEPFKRFAIYDNDASGRPPIVHVFGETVDEKDDFANFHIVLDQGSPVPITVSFETKNGSAVAGSDFVGESGSVTFNPSETVKTISIPIIDDAAAEGAQNFFLNITDVAGFTGASVANASAEAVIGVSDTAPLGTPTVSIGEQTVVEGQFERLIEIPITLNAPSTIPTSVQISTSNGTAITNSDFSGINRTLTFLPGETVKVVRIPTLDNSVSESTEQFPVSLSSPVGLIIGTPSRTFTILDDDPSQVSVSAVDVRKDEGDSGTTLFEFTITRSGDLSTAQTVLATVEGFTGGNASATSADFVGGAFPSATVSFGIGDTQQTITIPVLGDLVDEPDESFALRLSNPSTGLVVLHPLASATIANDDLGGGATEGDDNLAGTPGDDVIDLLGGNDVYTALGGDDVANGGLGNDTLRGDGGADTLNGGSGNDQITGGNNDDVINGGAGLDLLLGNGGNDSIRGESGVDTIAGGAGNDTIRAGGSNDDVIGQGGSDLILGDGGNDTLRGGSGDDTISGGSGNDIMFGNGNNDSLSGDGGNDNMQGAGGLDTLRGGTGNDTMTGGDGSDVLDGGTGDDVMNGGANPDRFVFATGYDEDRLNGFEQGVDVIELDDALWAGTLTGQQVVNTFGSLNGTGTILTLDFGGGDVLQVQNGAGINVATLGLDVDIV